MCQMQTNYEKKTKNNLRKKKYKKRILSSFCRNIASHLWAVAIF